MPLDSFQAAIAPLGEDDAAPSPPPPAPPAGPVPDVVEATEARHKPRVSDDAEPRMRVLEEEQFLAGLFPSTGSRRRDRLDRHVSSVPRVRT